MRSTNRTDRKKTAGQKAPGIVKTFYIAAAVLMAICIYMIVVNSMYVTNYASSYGMSLSDMKLDAFQYIVTGSISYFVYGALLFAAGRVISMLQKAQASGICKTPADGADVYEDIESEDFHVKDAGAEAADDQEHVDDDVEAVSGAADGSEEAEETEKAEKADEQQAAADPDDDRDDER